MQVATRVFLVCCLCLLAAQFAVAVSASPSIDLGLLPPVPTLPPIANRTISHVAGLRVRSHTATSGTSNPEGNVSRSYQSSTKSVCSDGPSTPTCIPCGVNTVPTGTDCTVTQELKDLESGVSFFFNRNLIVGTQDYGSIAIAYNGGTFVEMFSDACLVGPLGAFVQRFIANAAAVDVGATYSFNRETSPAPAAVKRWIWDSGFIQLYVFDQPRVAGFCPRAALAYLMNIDGDGKYIVDAAALGAAFDEWKSYSATDNC